MQQRPALGFGTALVISLAVVVGGLYVAYAGGPGTSYFGWVLVSVGGICLIANLALRDHLR